MSADEAERHEDGRYGINQNVLIEIGAAFALYDRRVVLVVDKRVQLPSNLQGLYRSEYEGDELGWTEGMKLAPLTVRVGVKNPDLRVPHPRMRRCCSSSA